MKHFIVVKTAAGHHVETSISHCKYTTGHFEGLGLKNRKNDGLTKEEANKLADDADAVVEERESGKRKKRI